MAIVPTNQQIINVDLAYGNCVINNLSEQAIVGFGLKEAMLDKSLFEHRKPISWRLFQTVY